MRRKSLQFCFSILTVATASCSSTTVPAADLPTGWEHATRIAEFTQKACDPADPSAAPAEAFQVSGVVGGVDLNYEHARFRCQQDVEGYVRVQGSAMDVLVQPVDLNPTGVPKCECMYDILAHFDAAGGSHAVTVYRRTDNYGAPSAITKIGSQMIEVPVK